MNTCLWTPSAERIKNARMTAFHQFLVQHDNYPAQALQYEQLHRWSIDEKARFWDAIWRFFEVRGKKSDILLDNGDKMPGARWFPDAKLNFAENLLTLNSNPEHIALVERGEHGRRISISFAELEKQVAKLSHFLRESGVHAGDVVAGILPNSHYAVVAMLATASLGAIWTSCSPDFGVQGILDRFEQTQPKILVACDGYVYANKAHHTLDKINDIVSQLDSVEQVVIAPYLQDDIPLESSIPNKGVHHWPKLLKRTAPPLHFEAMPFDAPLYVMYSSGTTGKPKCIVHSVGGTLLQHLKELALHTDVDQKSCLFYYSTCGWMMWNWLVSGLALGATLVLYDGSPFHPKQTQLFDLIDEEKITIFGGSAKYYAACEKAGLQPKNTHKLEQLRTLLSTGSPLSHESFAYLYREVKEDICVSSISGGTDIISCFALGCPILPVYQGELQCRGLGMDVVFVDDNGNPLENDKGELVCRTPFPSMPIGFWNDPDDKKYHDAYFARFTNKWAHGDYGQLCSHTKERDEVVQTGVIIHGRSDAVLNPGGVRIGTAEIYRQVEIIPEVLESLAIAQTWKDDVRIILFVRLQNDLKLDEVLTQRIKQGIRRNTTPRHVPAKIIQVTDIPRTLSGKIVELAVKKVVEGKAVNNTEALANPEALALFKDIPALQED